MRFTELHVPPADPGKTRDVTDALVARIAAAEDAAALEDVVRDWERARRADATYCAWVHLRHAQDVTDTARTEQKRGVDAMEPKLREQDVRVMNALLDSPHRPALEARIGATAFELWACAVTTFDPAIADDLVTESGLVEEVMTRLASANVEVDGETRTLPQTAALLEEGDRARREAGARAYWGWFDDNGAALDDAFDKLVKLRHGMAKKLGYDSYTELGYKLMSRIDYDADDVERFRAQVRDVLVPLCATLREQQAPRIGVDRVMYWDERVFDRRGSAKPKGDEAWMMERAKEMFDETHPALGDFFRMMDAGEFLDLDARPGKAVGGFCTSFPSHGVPFIFANFNGTSGDVRVFTHEAGHAFQCWMSREQPLSEYLWPTMEACEIHSMSLEFLTYPSMHRFFGDDADRFCTDHLREALLFIPYGVAIDHFQHLVYANPDATPAERHEMWREMEATYLPWRAYGDLPRVNEGAFWQRQIHVFFQPFYYIDYTLAQTCALQFWAKAQRDAASAIDDYVALCARGGSAPFQTLARSAGLRSPFDDGCLDEVVTRARQALTS